MGNEGFVTFNFGNSARSFVNLATEEYLNFSYEFTFRSHGRSDFKTTAPRGSGTLVVPVGTYTVTVKAFNGNVLQGFGNVESFVEVNPGKNTTAFLDMHSAVEVSDWISLQDALYAYETGLSGLPRKLYIFLQNSFSTNINSSMIDVRGVKYLIAEKNVTIDGSVFGSSSNMFNAGSSAEFHLGTEDMTGTITIKGRNNASGALIAVNMGEVYLYSGVTLRDNISSTLPFNDNGGAVFVNGGKFFMFGGTITNNRPFMNGGGVFVSGGAEFNMFGGVISGNTTWNGGGVFGEANSIISMYGGEISGNTATLRGGGVLIIRGDFEKTGGIIYGSSSGSKSNNALNGNNLPEPCHAIIYVFQQTSQEIFGYRNSTVSDNISVTASGVYTGLWDLYGY